MKSFVNSISNNGKFDSVKRFAMFFSSSRSRHTWLGAILDAAPNAMVANQRTWEIITRTKILRPEKIYTTHLPTIPTIVKIQVSGLRLLHPGL